MHANKIKDKIDLSKLTIGEALTLKSILGLTNSEAVMVFLGGIKHGDI